EHAALDARRDLPGGPVACAQGPRRAKHGAGAQVCLQQAQSRAAIQRPAEPSRQTLPTANQAAKTQEPQAPKKNRELGRKQARRNPHDPTRLSQINPDSEPCRPPQASRTLARSARRAQNQKGPAMRPAPALFANERELQPPMQVSAVLGVQTSSPV